MPRVAIVGGGPGGLLTAHLLERKYPGACRITLFEASHRLGGKIRTCRFASAPVPYEAGVAGCYDYSIAGRDPLSDLIQELGLETTPNDGGTVALDGRALREPADICRCCVYDESSRQECGGYGVLGWLLAGSAAWRMANLDDRSLADLVLHALPDRLYEEGAQCLLETKVHRWSGAVSAQPGGLPVEDPRLAHVPEPEEHPDLFVVGDYLFDSTLNGVFHSADVATGLWCPRTIGRAPFAGAVKVT